MEFWIYIPNHLELRVIIVTPQVYSLSFKQEIPSYIKVTRTCIYFDAHPVSVEQIQSSGDVPSIPEEYIYVPNYHRYGVYQVENNVLTYIKPWELNKIPSVDYKNKTPFMLQCRNRQEVLSINITPETEDTPNQIEKDHCM